MFSRMNDAARAGSDSLRHVIAAVLLALVGLARRAAVSKLVHHQHRQPPHAQLRPHQSALAVCDEPRRCRTRRQLSATRCSVQPALVVATSLSLTAPWLFARHITAQRRKRFVYQLPDALLALASALRAGCTLSRGLELMAERQPAPLSQEFTIVLAEYRVGRPLAESLDDMHRRIGAPELQLMNTAVNVSRRVGGNLADTLESLARTLQEKAHVEAKIDALTSMGRAQGWVVGLLPIFIGVVLYQQQPERMSLLFTQWYGWIVLGVVAAMMTRRGVDDSQDRQHRRVAGHGNVLGNGRSRA